MCRPLPALLRQSYRPVLQLLLALLAPAWTSPLQRQMAGLRQLLVDLQEMIQWMLARQHCPHQLQHQLSMPSRLLQTLLQVLVPILVLPVQAVLHRLLSTPPARQPAPAGTHHRLCCDSYLVGDCFTNAVHLQSKLCP